MKLKYVDSEIVFQEIPGEVTLAVNLSGCPCRCPGCHSKHLWGDIGQELTYEALNRLIEERGGGGITCLALMGGDAHPDEVDSLMAYIRQTRPLLHTAWYSGRAVIARQINANNFDYIKLGPFLKHLGSLKDRHTNQRLYKIAQGRREDITRFFWQKSDAE